MRPLPRKSKPTRADGARVSGPPERHAERRMSLSMTGEAVTAQLADLSIVPPPAPHTFDRTLDHSDYPVVVVERTRPAHLDPKIDGFGGRRQEEDAARNDGFVPSKIVVPTDGARVTSEIFGRMRASDARIRRRASASADIP